MPSPSYGTVKSAGESSSLYTDKLERDPSLKDSQYKETALKSQDFRAFLAERSGTGPLIFKMPFRGLSQYNCVTSSLKKS